MQKQQALSSTAFSVSALLIGVTVAVVLAEKLAAYRTGDAPHTINLTLLPLTESDVLLLGDGACVAAPSGVTCEDNLTW